MTLSALIEELERATAGSRELDIAIGRAVNWGGGDWTDWDVATEGGGLPRYTTSIDAALTLVPPECSILLALGHGAKSSVSIGTLGNAETKWIGDGNAPTGPLALCIAALKARQAMERGS